MLQPGQRIGRYELLEVLGHGGMGTVFDAMLHGPAGFQKRVALKVLKDGGEGLVREARLGGLLRHPNLVEVYALESIEDRWVCAMELVRGGSLRSYLPLPPRAVVEVGVQVCRGLHHAQQEVGLIHLDLKPGNLLIDHGLVKVADLGISRARGFTAQRSVKGTPKYMSPEHLGGGTVDSRADQFSLAVVLIELATGTATREPDAVPWLQPVLQRALAVHPMQRFMDFEGMAAALHGLQVEGPGLSEALAEREHAAPASTTTASATWTLALGDAPRTNLSPHLDAFIGRKTELAQLAHRLEQPGLLTVKGPGGVGKSRLAREATRRWLDTLDGEAWSVALSDCATEPEALQAIAEVLDLPLRRGTPEEWTNQIGDSLMHRGPVVLLLDGLEHLTALRSHIVAWLRESRELRILATSRTSLRVAGERRIELGPLPTADAITLLRIRAEATGAELGGDNRTLETLVEALDGLPLALELASARLTMSSAASLLDRLDQRFRLLRTADTAGRHATLEGTLRWSWSLLSADEQQAWVQCSVFVDGFTVEAAEAVLDLPGGTWALDALEQLLHHSILHRRPDGRLGMNQSTRAFGLDQSLDEAVTRRHAAWFARYGTQRAIDDLSTHGNVTRRHQLRVERGNLTAACEASIRLELADHAIGNLRALWAVLDLTGPYAQGRELSRRLVQLPGLTKQQRAFALRLDGATAQRTGATAQGLRAIEQSLQLFRDLGDDRNEAITIGRLAVASRQTGALVRSRDLAQQAIDRFQALGMRHGEGVCLTTLGNALVQSGDPKAAHDAFIRSLRIHEEVGDLRGEAIAHSNLAVLYDDAGKPDKALRHYTWAQRAYRQIGDRHGEALTLGNTGVVLKSQGKWDEALTAYRKALEVQKQAGNVLAQSIASNNIGNLLLDQGQVDEARESLLAALSGFQRVRNQYYEAHVRGNLGYVERCADQTAEARTWFESARDLAMAVGDRAFEAVWRSELGQLDLAEGQVESALRRLTSAATQLEQRLPVELALCRAALVVARQLCGEATVVDLEELEAAVAQRPKEHILVLCYAAHAQRLASKDHQETLARARRIAASTGYGERSMVGHALRVESEATAT